VYYDDDDDDDDYDDYDQGRVCCGRFEASTLRLLRFAIILLESISAHSHSHHHPPPPKSLLPSHAPAPTPTTPLHAMHPLLPLALLTLFLLAAAFIGYAIYATATEIAQKTTKKMESKNVVFSKDGMRVGVKEVRGDVYVDGTQRFVLFLRLCFWGWALGNGG